MNNCTTVAHSNKDHIAVDEAADAQQMAQRFFSAVFDPNDIVLFRPIETWEEAGKKKSRVDNKNTVYCKVGSSSFASTLTNQLEQSARNGTNLFFCVCPRVGDAGKFDQAWQIRIVRSLWADLDHITVDEATRKIAASKLPTPSVIVNSGNGVHAYWLLEQPYLIDDVGEPSPVLVDRCEDEHGRPKTRKYIIKEGERLYLDSNKHISNLSSKAQFIQCLLAGIAQSIGGDHTKDLSRLLRIPGSLNRKNQRNGTVPIPTQLVEFHPDRRYPIQEFEAFKSLTNGSRSVSRNAPLLPPKSAPSTATANTALAKHIARCGDAEVGQRSEADFHLCCYAIRCGISKADIWAQVQDVGKFGERGEAYFELTWGNAENKIRPKAPDEDEARLPTVSTQPMASAEPQKHEPSTNGNGGEKPVINVEPSSTPVGETLARVTDVLIDTGSCYRRAGQLIRICDGDVFAVLSSNELAGLLNQYAEFYFVENSKGAYKPFAPAYGNTWLNHDHEKNRLPAITTYTRNPVYTTDWRLVAPGYDAQSGIYYAGARIKPRNSTERLDTLLNDFCFKTPGDRTNFVGMLLTAILMPHFIGSKPAVLLCANQAGLGKTMLAQIISISRDGFAAETVSYNPNDEEFEKRLGAVVRRGATTIIIDNAKTRGRSSTIESACLERSITDAILSFRLLGQSDSIRAENSHIFCITANSPEVSRDLVTRSIVVNLEYDGDPSLRTFAIEDPEGYALDHRLELLGELLGMVEAWKAAGSPLATTRSRFNKKGWGHIVGGILQVANQPDFMANAAEASKQLDETEREFAELVVVLVDQGQETWTATELAAFCETNSLLLADLGDRSARSRATKFGRLAGRFVNTVFLLDEERCAVFARTEGRKGNEYCVRIEEKPAER